ncbi:hypothetical protein EV127DRAFT_211335 [Xylaria flabelliformis]|nr:hypothetical protein EV127DRAFT_211335 [Xylaria flabelliformis]
MYSSVYEAGITLQIDARLGRRRNPYGKRNKVPPTLQMPAHLPTYLPTYLPTSLSTSILMILLLLLLLLLAAAAAGCCCCWLLLLLLLLAAHARGSLCWRRHRYTDILAQIYATSWIDHARENCVGPRAEPTVCLTSRTLPCRYLKSPVMICCRRFAGGTAIGVFACLILSCHCSSSCLCSRAWPVPSQVK